MINICCYCETWQTGGIESFLTNIWNVMDRNELNIELYASTAQHTVYDATLKSLGIAKHSLVRMEHANSMIRVLFGLLPFYRSLKAKPYTAVHLNLYHGVSLLYGEAAKLAGVPIIIAHSHNSTLRKSKSQAFKMLAHRTARWLFSGCATEFWACSQTAAEFMFPKKLSGKVRIVPDGIDLSRFALQPDVRRQTRLKLNLNGRFVIGNVGRLCAQKNQSFLLDAFACVRKICSSAVLLLVGDGDCRSKLENQAQRLGVRDSVIFYGTTDNIPPLLWAMDVFAFPSQFEGLGIVAIEAQAAGLPILCSENVPPEARATPLAEALPLDAGPEKWACKLLSMKNLSDTQAAEKLKCQGFDIHRTAETVKTAYSPSACPPEYKLPKGNHRKNADTQRYSASI